MRIFKDAFNSIVSVTGEFSDSFFSVIGIGFFMRAGRSVDQVFSIADIIITWGMAFIVGYGVLRIVLNLIWNIFFGRDFKWKLGIVEKLFLRLKPLQIQEKVQKAITDDQEESVKRMKVIMKKRRNGGGVKMGFKKFMSKLNANKWTILGVTSIASVTALGAFGVVDVNSAIDFLGNLNNLGAAENISQGVISTAVIAGAAGVGIKSVLSAGPESVENFQARKAEEKAAKALRKENKANGTGDLERIQRNLMRKIGLSEDEAKAIADKTVANKKKAHKEMIAKKEAEIEAKKVAKRNRKLEKMGIDPDAFK